MNRLILDTYFALEQVMLNFGLSAHASRAVDVSTVTSFIRSLKPVHVQHSLIRVGGESDGGYLIPNDLEGIDFCFSPGVSSYAPFEIDLEKRGIKSFLADYSVDRAPFGLSEAAFLKKYIGGRVDDIYITLDSWINGVLGANGGDLILQMDIEGSEYEAILATSEETLSRFRIIVVELHNLHRLFDRVDYGLMATALAKITNRFHVVHLHPNNFAPALHRHGIAIPDLLEVTFLRKDRAFVEMSALVYPHPLDRRCSRIRSDFTLPKCWYS
jgi:hypothetical protein